MSYIGTTKIGGMYLGSTEIAKAYLGSSLVYQKGTPAPNYAYEGIYLSGASGGVCTFGIYTTTRMISPIFSTVGASSVTFSTGNTRQGGFYIFTDAGKYQTYYLDNANPRTVALSAANQVKNNVLCFRIEDLASAYVYDETNGKYLFKGDELSSTLIHTSDDFRSESILANAVTWENARGDFANWNYTTSSSFTTTPRTTYNPPIYRKIHSATSSDTSEFTTLIGKYVTMPKNYTDGASYIAFSVGGVYSGTNPCLLIYDDDEKTANYYAASSNPRTVTIGASRDRVRIYCKMSDYPNAYIKDAYTNTMLWEGA